MATLFPGTTNIVPLTRVRRERRLVRPGEVAVRVGQQVSSVQIIARMEQSGPYTVLSPAETLGLAPEEVAKNLLVPEGALVEEGTELVQAKGSFGRLRLLKSPISGTFSKLINGRILLRRPNTLFELRAMMPGYVISLIGNRGAMVETFGSLVQGLWSSGQDGYGNIAIVGDGPDHVLTREDLDIELRGHILVAGHLFDIDVLRTAEDMGIRGVVVGSVPSALCQLADLFRLPVLVTDHIGKQPMSSRTYELLQGASDREATLLGAPQFSRKHRPELIIPLPANQDVALAAGPEKGLAEGQTVRLTREPYRGTYGLVRSIPATTRLLPNGVRSRGALVELGNGSTIFVADRNMEIIT